MLINHPMKRLGVMIKTDHTGCEHLSDGLVTGNACRAVAVAAAAAWISEERFLSRNFHQHSRSMEWVLFMGKMLWAENVEIKNVRHCKRPFLPAV